VEGVITSELFQVPTTAARSGSRLAVVNAKFDTGIPPTADQCEVIVVDREHGSPPYSSSRLIAGWPWVDASPPVLAQPRIIPQLALQGAGGR
jgi:hypothetical protein